MKHPNILSLLDYKTVVAKNLIQYHQDRKRAVPMSRPSKRKNQPESIYNHEGYLSDYQTMRKRCAYCAIEGKENRTFVTIMLSKGKKLFPKASHLGVHIIHTLYIFAKTLWFLFGFYMFPQPP